MSTLNISDLVFITAAFLYQIVLLINFIGRNLQPELEQKYGWILYAMSVPALIAGGVYLLNEQPWYFTSAFFLFALWGGFGYYVDIYRKIQWRNPTKISVMVPYVGLYVGSLFSFWIPLWNLSMIFWWAFTIFYVVNTILNIVGHRGFGKPDPSEAKPAI